LSSSYGSFCGTSAATPFVSGLAGLVRSYNLSASAASVVSAIEQTAQPLASGNSIHGLINANYALRAIASAATYPIASFTSSAVSGAAPLVVSFTNTSANATSYLWSFGDGTSSAEASPSHTFTTPGTYSVTLTVGNGTTSSLASTTITVTEPAPVASFTPSKVSGYAPLSVSFANTSSNAASYLWSFGDSTPNSIEATPSHTFTQAGTFTVTLTATGPGGVTTASNAVTVVKARPDLAVSLIRKASKVSHGYRFSLFKVTLRNRGGADDQGVKIAVTLPSGARFASISLGGRVCPRTLRRATCSVGALSAGWVAKLSFVARVAKRADVKVVASGKQAEISLANNVARVKTR